MAIGGEVVHSQPKWIPIVAWIAFGAGVALVRIPAASFGSLLVGLLITYLGVRKGTRQRTALLIVGWSLLGLLAAILVLGMMLWGSFEL
ncbi:hypothetical protein [Microbacterium mangrovi]|nr:hypothetical protein [Microbacterium mangrovi]